MTSNLGGGGDEAMVMAAVHHHFKPEFVNRIDEIVVFHRLDERHIAQIVDIQVDAAARRGSRSAGSASSSPTRPASTSPGSATTRTSAPARSSG